MERVERQAAAGGREGAGEVRAGGQAVGERVERPAQIGAQGLGDEEAPLLEGRGVAQIQAGQQVAPVERGGRAERLDIGGVAAGGGDLGAEGGDVERQGAGAQPDLPAVALNQIGAARRADRPDGLAQSGRGAGRLQLGPEQRGQGLAAVAPAVDR